MLFLTTSTDWISVSPLLMRYRAKKKRNHPSPRNIIIENGKDDESQWEEMLATRHEIKLARYKLECLSLMKSVVRSVFNSHLARGCIEPNVSKKID